jgi:hypothetical protein
MVTRGMGRVKEEELLFDLGRACVEVLAAKRLGLLRQAKHRYMRADVLREPRLVHLEVVMGDAHADPASPRERFTAAHRGERGPTHRRCEKRARNAECRALRLVEKGLPRDFGRWGAIAPAPLVIGPHVERGHRLAGSFRSSFEPRKLGANQGARSRSTGCPSREGFRSYPFSAVAKRSAAPNASKAHRGWPGIGSVRRPM